MGRIELNHVHVSGCVEAAGIALNQLSLHAPSGQGVSHLAITNDCQEREKMVHQLISLYIEGVHKNLVDTQANVDLLKRQDEVIR